MSEKETKLSVKIEEQEMPQFLRALADFLEGKNVSSFLFPENLTSIEKLKIKIERNKNGSFSAKWKTSKSKMEVEEDEDDKIFLPLTDDESSPIISYKELKKRMKKSFKEIIKQVDLEVMPSPMTVASFIEDSETMMTFEDDGYGEKYYNAYKDGMEKFQNAFDQKHIPKLKTTLDELKKIVSDCHDKFK